MAELPDLDQAVIDQAAGAGAPPAPGAVAPE